MSRFKRARVLRYAVTASGWVFLVVFFMHGYQELGANFLSDLFFEGGLAIVVLHRSVFLAPVITTFVGYIMKKQADAEKAALNAMEKVSKSERRFKGFFEGAASGMAMVDADGVFLEVNESMCSMTGYSAEELRGRSFRDVTHPDDLKKNEDVIARLLTGEAVSERFEKRYLTKSGEVVCAIANASVIRDTEGRILHFITEVLDITDRKRAEEALRESEERYRTLIDNVGVGISVISPEMEIISLNRKMLEWFPQIDTSALPLCYKSFNSPARDEICSYCPCVKTLADGETHTAITETPVGDGIMNYHIVASPLKDGDGNVTAVIEMVEDITERSRAEDALKENRQFLENILNSIQDGICVLDREFTIILANPTINRWYSEMAPVVGKKCYEVFRYRVEKCEPCDCAEPVFEGANCFRVVDYKRPDGSVGARELYGFPLYSPGGKVTGIIQYYRDISDKVALQAEAMRAAQLASVGELAAGVAHEINNPVNGIINYAQLLKSRLDGDGDEGNIAERIMKEGDRISGIVSALLSFTRASGSVSLPVDIAEALDEVLSLVGALLRKDGIEIRKAVPEELPAVSGNRQQLEQVFLNIINNARHALNTRHSEIDGEKFFDIGAKTINDHGVDYVRLTFTDTGTGIPGDMLEKVTEPFFTTKPKGVGTGLGLSISESIIDNHGGRLNIESEEGSYTKVIIELPADTKP